MFRHRPNRKAREHMDVVADGNDREPGMKLVPGSASRLAAPPPIADPLLHPLAFPPGGASSFSTTSGQAGATFPTAPATGSSSAFALSTSPKQQGLAFPQSVGRDGQASFCGSPSALREALIIEDYSRASGDGGGGREVAPATPAPLGGQERGGRSTRGGAKPAAREKREPQQQRQRRGRDRGQGNAASGRGGAENPIRDLQREQQDQKAKTTLLRKMRRWKEELWASLKTVDKDLHKTAEQCHRELSDGEKPELSDEQPIREACRAVLHPTPMTAGSLGTDMSRLTCEGLLTEMPAVLKTAVMETVPATMEEVISLSSNLLEEMIVQAKEDEIKGDIIAPAEKACSSGNAGPSTSSISSHLSTTNDKVKLHKFLEFYKGYRERSLRSRMEKLRQQIERDTSTIVQDACQEAVAQHVMQHNPNGQDDADNYQKIVEDLPRVPLEAAKNIHQRFSALVDKCVGEIEEMQTEIVQNDNYNTLVIKLRDMVIAEPRKKSRGDSLPRPLLESKRASADEGTPRQDEANDPSADKAVQQEEDVESGTQDATSETTSATHMILSSPAARRGSLRLQTLTELCIATCAYYVDYLPELPEGCFPEDLLQQLLCLLCQQRKISDNVLARLLSPSLIHLDLHSCLQLSDSSCVLLSQRCTSIRRLNLSHCSEITDDGLLLLSSCIRLEELELEGCIELGDQALSALARKCSCLRSLNLSGCTKLTDVGVNDILSLCRGLARLHLRKCQQLTDNAFRGVTQCAKLVDLDISDSHQVSDATMTLLCGCAGLESLKIGGRTVSDAGVLPLATSCRRIQVLELIACEITDHSVWAISSTCASLRHLSLPHCRKITDAAFVGRQDTLSASSGNALFGNAGGHMYNLRSLDLTRCVAVSDAVLLEVAKFCPKIHTVILHSCEEITDRGMLALAERCTFITTISVAKCKQLTDRSLTALIRANAQRLQSLNVENCHLITNETIMCLALNRCTNLLDLDISSCDSISDEAVLPLLQTCDKLESLSLEELTNLSEHALSAIGGLRNLKRLRVGYCRGVTDACLEAISACTQLTSIDLSYCNNPLLTVPGLQRLLDLLPPLQILSLRGCSILVDCILSHPTIHTLNLSWCKNLQDEVLEGIAKGFSQLRVLDLAWCGRITGAAVHRLAQRVPSLRTFNLRGCSRVPALTIQFLTHANKVVYR